MTDMSNDPAIRAAIKTMDVAIRPGPNGMGEFYAAFAKAQGEFQPIEKNKDVFIKSEKGNYSFKYADLAEIRAKTTPALSANSICAFQLVTEDKGGDTLIRTVLGHSSGCELESTLRVNRAGEIKNFGAAITYLRRYVLSAVLGVAADDDVDENGQPADDAGTSINTPVHPGLRDAQTIGELSKLMTSLKKEDKVKYAAYFNQRQDEIEAASKAAAGANRGDDPL